MSQIVYPITFNGYDLNNVSGLTILSTNPYSLPKRDITISNIVRTNQSKINTGFYSEKNIIVSIGITRSTRALLESSIDTLMTNIQGLEKLLILNQSGLKRQYTATFIDSIIKVSGGSYIEMDLVFACSDRYGYDLVYEQLLYATGRTLYNYTDTLTFGGSADRQVPVITVTLTSFTGSTTNMITVGNVGLSQYMTINRAWTAGDILVINTQTRTVKVNGTDVDFSGPFPEFAPGVGYLNYQDNFSVRNISLNVYYYKRFV